ncbi:hypothetical protein W97_06983 [Coniosporium apollinis CBS 100218]|uniref:Geranylgeranyl transferase type-2 subunit alpha n=1 Tax=Coniosporium apollinis (strain CBS 100218) TaxID=1168221 RepID=R7Z117_CONA1|nr:uncharacterized protein W97_06983 [Coniosporium apollinis CBS 100218]EON67729.1 hypothetical protein W97_06983 [Coniosporium apollinis CBS 100218]
MASHGVPRIAPTEARTGQARQKELEKIEEYVDLVAQVNKNIAERHFTIEVLALTSKLLKRNPEDYTVWNHRRLILQHHFKNPPAASAQSQSVSTALSASQQSVLDLITSDLGFLVPLLVAFPKCYWIWNHRIWLLEQSTSHLPAITVRRLWQDELSLVGKMLNRDKRNFHGWNYRRLVVAQLELHSPSDGHADSSDTSRQTSMVETEFIYTTKMINSDLGNFSAWHNRSKLIPRLLDERQADAAARRKMLDAEFDLTQQGLIDPENQSMWFYHQSLMSTLSPECPRHAAIVLDLTNHDRCGYYERELARVKEMLDDYQDCKWVYQALLQYAAVYREVDAGNKACTTTEMRHWLRELQRLDPLRSGRWDDIEKSLGL